MRAAAAFAAVTALRRPEIWLGLRSPAEVETDLAAAQGPLAGLLLAVKNNVDVAGFVTTAGCPSFADKPADEDAPAVARLRAAGATVIGVTNLDQFATGLVGQRSPHGGVRDARRPEYISGGSSSGSAVAVALGLADIAIGTDTAGSGRIPAALQGVVGIKPTLGLVSTKGVVPACRSWDAVTILARDLDTASLAMGFMAGGSGTRPWPTDAPLAAPTAARIAVPAALPGLSENWVAAFGEAVERLRADGCTVEEIAFDTFLDAAKLLYDGALVAERHAAVGDFIDSHAGDAAVDPIVGAIIRRAGTHTASALVRDTERLDALRQASLALLDGYDALLVPTAPGHPTIAQVAADPVGVNSWMGTYTNFANLFDLCGVAVPSGTAGDDQFGVTVLARPFHDAVALELARRVQVIPPSVAAPGAVPPRTGFSPRADGSSRAGVSPQADLSPRADLSPWPIRAGLATERLLLVGAHLRGQPLSGELERLGARWGRPVTTAAAYRLSVLDTTPPKPGLERVGPGGSAIAGELCEVSVGALGTFLSALPAPMNLGPVELADGTWVVGFGCNAEAARSGKDISAYGGWRNWLAR